MNLSITPIHKKPEYKMQCCQLINDEWKRSETARLRGLECSCDGLPTNIILLDGEKLIGHSKLSKIPSVRNGCFLESVVIDKNLRGKGFGTILMQKLEQYCKNIMQLELIYLSTKGQEEFYRKLGYKECGPISIYGSTSLSSFTLKENASYQNIPCHNPTSKDNVNIPPPPTLPTNLVKTTGKIYMMKHL